MLGARMQSDCRGVVSVPSGLNADADADDVDAEADAEAEAGRDNEAYVGEVLKTLHRYR